MKNKKQEKQLKQVLFAAVVGFFAWVLAFINITPTEESSEFLVKQHAWTTALVNNILNNRIFYLIVVVFLLGLGYFLFRKKKRN